MYFVFWYRYTINDRNLGRLLSRISTTYNTELQLWKVSSSSCFVIMILLLFSFIISLFLTLFHYAPLALQMEHFFSLTPDAGAGEMSRKQALETARNNIEWISRNENEIRWWLESNVAEP